MSTPPFSYMTSVYQILGEIIAARLERDGDADLIRKVLLDEMRTTRHSLVRDPASLSEVWAKLRAHVPATDFLLDVTTQLNLALVSSALPLSNLTENLAKAASAYTHNESVVDDDLRKRLPNEGAVKKLYESNLWFVVLQLIEHRSGWYLIKPAA